MKRPTLYVGGIIILIILWLLLYRRASKLAYAEPIKVPSVPQLTFVIDQPRIEVPGSRRFGEEFDWMGDGDCGCVDTRGTDHTIITTVTTKRAEPGYYPVAPPYINIPQYVKGSLPLYRNPTMPDLPMYRAPTPTFWWGWSGLSRVIYTSDGHTLRTGLSNTLWNRADGGNIFQPIQSINYNGQVYQLDSSRSVGL